MTTIKRLVDVAVLLAMLPLVLPLLLVIAIAIRLDSKGPALFRQTRIGKGGRRFVLMKFRTMQNATSAVGPEGQVLEDRPLDEADSRITRVGRVLRRTSLDELPQLVNVLRGEMSLVGPRPTIPEQVAQYGEFERRRLDVLPGLTGLAQISGRNALTWPERIKLDVQYVERWSIWLDCKILCKTVVYVLKPGDVYHEGGVQGTHR